MLVVGVRLSNTASTNAGPELTFLISAILLQFFIAISYCVGISFRITPLHIGDLDSATTSLGCAMSEWQGAVVARQKQHGRDLGITLWQNVSDFCSVTNRRGWFKNFQPSTIQRRRVKSKVMIPTWKDLFMLTITRMPRSTAATVKFGSPTLILCLSSMLRNAVLKNRCSIMLIGMLFSKLPLLNHKSDFQPPSIVQIFLRRAIFG